MRFKLTDRENSSELVEFPQADVMFASAYCVKAGEEVDIKCGRKNMNILKGKRWNKNKPYRQRQGFMFSFVAYGLAYNIAWIWVIFVFGSWKTSLIKS